MLFLFSCCCCFQFQRHIKKSEGQKAPKVELHISIYGVRILDPKTKEVLHNCQLHRMSFCADDKTDKRIFTFICTDPETKRHLCYVFDSEKCAEEITLAIGQAFDLAYKKFLESGGKDMETRKQIGNLQKRIQDLEAENSRLKRQLQELEDQLINAQVSPAGSIPLRGRSTDIFDMVPFLPVSPMMTMMANSRPETPPPSTPPPPPPPPPPPCLPLKDRSEYLYVSGIDLFGAEPFDPYSCGLADYSPDIQSKLDEMQVSAHTHTHTHAHTSVRTHTHTHADTHTCTHTHTLTHTLNSNTYVHTHILSPHRHAHTHPHTYIHPHTCTVLSVITHIDFSGKKLKAFFTTLFNRFLAVRNKS
ncbi:hypothetical protein ACEWY4_016970 [Coilia grayii]|uniref:PID domain-containing protein n=1 Tax=Coilia grayii TaxID=363190 RepID=A0ABD1JLX3_9TELE